MRRRHRGPRRVPDYAVHVNFSGEIYPGSDFEKKLEEIARGLDGEPAGGGTDFKTRDASYAFDRFSAALMFASRALRFKRVNRADVVCGHCGADATGVRPHRKTKR